MTAGVLNLVIYKGGAFATTLTFYATGTTTPVDPGVGGSAALGKNQDAPDMELTVVDTNHATGQITLTATPAQTALLKLGPVPWAYMNGDGTVYVQGVATVTFTPAKYA